jgi:glucosamine kinase
MSTQSPLLIAVDGGGTGCRAAVGTAAAGVLAQAKGGPANINNSFDGTVHNIIDTVARALDLANVSAQDLSAATAHIGIAGADTLAARDRIIEALPYGTCTITGDRETSVVGVLGKQDGYVLGLGTGTIIARQNAGVVSTVNGWGFEGSDHGSGAWLGHQMIIRVLLSEDGMEPVTPLCRRISTQMDGLHGLVAFSRAAAPADYAKFARDVFEAAEQKDALALDLLRLGVGFLERGLDALSFETGDALSLSGGVGPHYLPYLAERFTRNIQPAKGNALDGAFTLAQLAAHRG